MFKFKFTYVALTAALSSSFVYADPTTYTHSSGAKVIDIEKPNAAGVSHNMYREFNVDNNGLILNNSANDLTHNTLGNIAKNNNLTTGSASVILNEVTSNKSSSLNGFIEVAGQKADVVVANPNGISCSGCSFINTNNAILTTGKVELSYTGAIANYTITGGKLTIGQNGMDATNSYAVLMADAINLNGIVQAKNATISAGNFTLDNSTNTITSAGKSASLKQALIPEYSIDISSLGGVKANSITMVGNNYGFGVRNKGVIVANSTLAMTSYGSLINENSIASNGYLAQMVSAGELKNTGTIATKNIAIINSYGKLNNSGTISNTSQMSVAAAGNLSNSGTIHATNLLSVATNGNLNTTYYSWLGSDNQVEVTALGNIDNAGSIRAKNTTVTFGGDTLKVTGDIMGPTTMLVQASKNGSTTSGEITNSGTISGGNVTVKTNGSLITNYASVLKATESLTTQSYWLNNNGGIQGHGATMNINNTVTNNSGHIKGDTLSVNTYLDMVNTGTFETKGNLTINTQNNGIITNEGTIKAGDTLTLSAKKVVNEKSYKCGFLNLKTCTDKGTLTANKLILNSSHKYASNMGGTQNFKATEINTQ